jgi:hypothetical protein
MRSPDVWLTPHSEVAVWTLSGSEFAEPRRRFQWLERSRAAPTDGESVLLDANIFGDSLNIFGDRARAHFRFSLPVEI